MNLLGDLRIWGLVLLCSVLDTAAALAAYYAGQRGIEAVLGRFPRLRQERWERVQRLYDEHGAGLLFFCSLPMVGCWQQAPASPASG